MRSLPHSVVVVTASKIRLEGALLDSPIHIKSAKPTTPRDYRGMTVSSFTTLTLTPEPIISFNVKFPSQTLAAIEHSRHFLIHILEASENGMKIAREFTKGSRHVEKIFFGSTKGFGIKPISVKTRFEGKDMCLPMLRERGVMGVLRCEVLGNIGGGKSGLVKVGDHMLVLAKVEEILDGGGKEGEQERVKGGLCYADGRYRRVGDVIKGERDIIEVKEDPIEGKKDWVEVVIDMKKDGEE